MLCYLSASYASWAPFSETQDEGAAQNKAKLLAMSLAGEQGETPSSSSRGRTVRDAAASAHNVRYMDNRGLSLKIFRDRHRQHRPRAGRTPPAGWVPGAANQLDNGPRGTAPVGAGGGCSDPHWHPL